MIFLDLGVGEMNWRVFPDRIAMRKAGGFTIDVYGAAVQYYEERPGTDPVAYTRLVWKPPDAVSQSITLLPLPGAVG